MQPDKFIKAIFCNHLSDPVSIILYPDSDGFLCKSEFVPVGSGMLYLEGLSGGRYYIGEWLFSGNRIFPSSSIRDPEFSTDLQNKMDASAIQRLHVPLKMDSSVSIVVVTEDNIFHGHVKPLGFADASPFFTCTFDDVIQIVGGKVLVKAYIRGAGFAFESEIIGHEDKTMALKLPVSADRIMRRSVPRSDVVMDVDILSPVKARGKIINLSHLGMCIECPEIQKPEKWSEFDIVFGCGSDRLNIHALVVGSRNNLIQLVMSGVDGEMKKRFYVLSGLINSCVKLSENPESAWQCLEDFGYVNLLKDNKLSVVKNDCLAAWNSNLQSEGFFQPVASINNAHQGTYSITQSSHNHWFRHSLAVKVDPSALAATEALYMSIPAYLMSRAEHGWVSGWYDNKKKWHNRFFKVFINENKDHPELLTFVRHWFWASELKKSDDTGSVVLKTISEVDADTQKYISDKMVERYGAAVLRSAVMSLEEESHDHFTMQSLVLYDGNNPVGFVKILHSKHEMNPFSVLNSAHVNVFDESLCGNNNFITSAVESITNVLIQNKCKRAALSLDYVFSCFDGFKNGFSYVDPGRCLSLATCLMPSFVSNNLLCFSDMRCRHQISNAEAAG